MLPTERGRELDAAVAVEIMNWEKRSVSRGGVSFEMYWDSERAVAVPDRWGPSVDMHECTIVESQIERRGLIDVYVSELQRRIKESTPACGFPWVWLARRVTTEQICLAALAAVREARGATNAD